MGATEFDKPLDHDLDELNSNINPSDYSTTGLSYGTGVSLDSGGYLLIGKLCIVQMVLTTSSSVSAWVDVVTGLPHAKGMSGGGNPLIYSQNNVVAAQNNNGKLNIFARETIASGATVKFFAVYLAS